MSIGYIKILGNNSSVDALLQKRKERFVGSSNLFAESYVLLLSYVIKMSKNGLDYKKHDLVSDLSVLCFFVPLIFLGGGDLNK